MRAPAFVRSRARTAGFTLIEIGAVIVIVLILVVLLMPALAQFTARADRVKCTANLRNLYTGANSYVVDRGSWPQIDPKTVLDPSYPVAWREALAPYGVPNQCWICPTVQRSLGNPDVSKPENARVDYIAMPFGPRAMAPYQWPGQPWFLERADVHGSGNLVIFTDGHVASLGEIKAQPMSEAPQ